jgi:hypothetical protein
MSILAFCSSLMITKSITNPEEMNFVSMIILTAEIASFIVLPCVLLFVIKVLYSYDRQIGTSKAILSRKKKEIAQYFPLFL